MPVFHYQGRNSRGEPVSGRVEAASVDQIADQLMGLGIVPIKIREEAEKAQGANFEEALANLSKQKVSTIDVVFFSRQIYTMLRAGIPVMQALDGLLQTTANKTLVEVIRSIRDKLNAGLDFSSAIASHPDIFSRLYVSMVRVGETTGGLVESFAYMAEFIQKEKEMRDKVKGALRYPVIVLVAISIGMFIINLKVIPAFSGMFSKLGADLPLMTQILIGTSNFVKGYWYLVIGGVVAAIAGFRWFIRTADGHMSWDRFKLRMPVFGTIIQWATLARFARAMAITTKAGIPVSQALPIVASAVDNVFVEARLKTMQGQIEGGTAIHKAAESTGLFPPLVLQMLKIGEETGDLEGLIQEVAEFYEREVDYNVANLSSVIEPILIGLIGIVVTVLALGVFMPMWDLINVAKGK